MPYPQVHKIVIGGKKYIDLYLLENNIAAIYPLKSHSLRRLARYGRIPYKRIGMSRKDWFNLEDVKKALNLVLEDDDQLVEVDENAGEEINEFIEEIAQFQPSASDIELPDEEDFTEGL